MGFRGLTLEQRQTLEDRIQQEYFNFHFKLQGGTLEDRTALESQIDREEREEIEAEKLRLEMHPWHGKNKQERKEYIEKLLLKFKNDQISKDENENVHALAEFNKKKNTSPKNRKRSPKAIRTRFSKSGATRRRNQN